MSVPSALPRRAAFIVFEGIDGSGKTTISNRVADELAARGLRVVHVRAGGRLASEVAESIRQFTRDQRNVGLQPFTEFLLYVARERQQLEDSIEPALASADVVIADRYFFTAEVLAHFGRGLPRELLEPVLASARKGIAPTRTILIDVDPQIAKARRRADKIARPTVRTSSRKGLSGAGLMTRLREGYLQLADADPAGWMVVDNSGSDLHALIDELTDAVDALVRPAAPGGATTPLRRPHPASGLRTPADAVAAFLAKVDDIAAREPEVAAYLLGGLAGPGVDERRRAMAARTPSIIANGLRGLDDGTSWILREQLLAAAPEQVAKSLGGLPVESPASWAMRWKLASIAPDGVASSLDDRFEAEAWALRERLWEPAPTPVVQSLCRDDSRRAWDLRELWLAENGGEAALGNPELARALASSLRGVGSARAWALREAARAASPVGALLSIHGLDDERAWAWRRELLTRAPRPVLRTIDGLDHPIAWELREASVTLCKEGLDSIVGLDGERAWALREAAADRWPSTVMKSLGDLAGTPRGQALGERLLARYGENLSLLKHATHHALSVAATAAPAWARAVANP